MSPDSTERRRAIQPKRRDPERSRQRILDVAIAEFAQFGLGGARVDRITKKAGVNARMLYHYFGSKEHLFTAVLEEVYGSFLRFQQSLRLAELSPVEGIRQLVRGMWAFYRDNPEFISIVGAENRHMAAHLRASTKKRELQLPILEVLKDLLKRGVAEGVFRSGVDPIQLYISLAALGYFYFSNQHTLSTVVQRNLMTERALKMRRAHVEQAIYALVLSERGQEHMAARNRSYARKRANKAPIQP